MTAKPHLRIVEGKTVRSERRESAVEAARRRHGKPFAHEAGSTFKPRSTRLLTEWMASRVKKESA